MRSASRPFLSDGHDPTARSARRVKLSASSALESYGYLRARAHMFSRALSAGRRQAEAHQPIAELDRTTTCSRALKPPPCMRAGPPGRWTSLCGRSTAVQSGGRPFASERQPGATGVGRAELVRRQLGIIGADDSAAQLNNTGALVEPGRRSVGDGIGLALPMRRRD
jgi:hypothetical protein